MNGCKMSAPANPLGSQPEGSGSILREATGPMPHMRKNEKQTCNTHTGDILKLYRNRLFLMCLFLLGCSQYFHMEHISTKGLNRKSCTPT